MQAVQPEPILLIKRDVCLKEARRANRLVANEGKGARNTGTATLTGKTGGFNRG